MSRKPDLDDARLHPVSRMEPVALGERKFTGMGIPKYSAAIQHPQAN